ncbi:hypothetical protein EVAR_22226_1 [Eumeta japonica]|uniref:Uncharacterized protein n=1 Tax=Eumeta variegata TaxID=151549 RepID=A0A4C1UAM2_EUMVA|nr:hypothetical protein EVAR_22226_1 [Eumeta japonica]
MRKGIRNVQRGVVRARPARHAGQFALADIVQLDLGRDQAWLSFYARRSNMLDGSVTSRTDLTAGQRFSYCCPASQRNRERFGAVFRLQ